MSVDGSLRDHLQWLNFLQPEGLVVSARALVDKQVILDRDAAPALQARFLETLKRTETDADGEGAFTLEDLAVFAREFLGWPAERLAGPPGAEPLPEALHVPLPELGETLSPSFALRDPASMNGDAPWLLLAQTLPTGTDLDAEPHGADVLWRASKARRFERLLRETRVPIGLLTNGTEIRLVYAPRGESAGSVAFPLAAMSRVDGRPILLAFHELLKGTRLFVGPKDARLPAILEASRRYQAHVSTRLSAQVLEALYELLRGFQEADDRVNGTLLGHILETDPDHVYGGLLNVLMRLVFLLYAEDRGLLPADPLFRDNYSVHGLAHRLREDAERNPDTMDLRPGAWAHLAALFRLVHGGSRHPRLRMPPRLGYLFDPDRFLFLEGRTLPEAHLPAISDGVVQRILDRLLILDGERLSYRALDVEQIGSVYEAIMVYRIERAAGRSIALKPAKAHGATKTLDLDALLAEPASKRVAWLLKRSGHSLQGKAAQALRGASTLDELLQALGSKVAKNVTPSPVRKGAMVLEPNDLRRSSGSHYTPRSLTEPIVRKALEPHLRRLGENARPEDVLDLKICDPAMGSGAFLVEACRQLADRLVKAWERHGSTPTLPPDEDALLFAERLVARRCLYGVDINPFAVDLAKLSLWLVTLARDHPFTFLDHALRTGDSLVGLDEEQIAEFHWDRDRDASLFAPILKRKVSEARGLRERIREAGDLATEPELRALLEEADASLEDLRLIGEQVIAAFFSSEKPKARQGVLDRAVLDVVSWQDSAGDPEPLRLRAKALRDGDRPVTPFHWPVEFPEVFLRENPGFDAIVGNPPFLGGRNLTQRYGRLYADWLIESIPDSTGSADLVARFFRRGFSLLRENGTFGLLATKTIAQGDTRSSGLRWICTHGGEIYAARKRYKWPGAAAVVVSIVHVAKGSWNEKRDLDGQACDRITAFLFTRGGHEDPARLRTNEGKSFVGSYVLGMGFTFDDTDTKGVASPIAEMHRLIEKDPRNRERIFPYIGGEEVNTSPTHAHHRYIIDFGVMNLDEARAWPDLLHIVEDRVKPQRDEVARERYRATWWRFAEPASGLYAAIRGLERVLVIGRNADSGAVAFLPSGMVHSEQLIVFPLSTVGALATLQSRPHQMWARFFSGSMKEDLRYTPSDCFETFPFPLGFETDPRLEAVGRAYYEHRAAVMLRLNEGLTKVYNRFHDPEDRDPGIATLRELHASMDRAVLDAYGWNDISTACEFIPERQDEDDDGDDDGAGKSRTRYRFQWPEPVREDVLARLIALNAERAAEEARLGVAVTHARPDSAEDDDQDEGDDSDD